MKWLAVVLGLLTAFGLAYAGPVFKLSDYQSVLELARTVNLLTEIDVAGLTFDTTQATNMRGLLQGVNELTEITPNAASILIKKLEMTLHANQLLALGQRRQALEVAAQRRVSQARIASKNALTVMAWTVPGGPLIVAIIEREQKVNPFRVRGSQEAFAKLLVVLDQRSK